MAAVVIRVKRRPGGADGELMRKTFPIVRRGYSPPDVDAFVREQAEAWRGELAKAFEDLEEWRSRSESMAQTVLELEKQVAADERRHREETGQLESALAEMRWARDEALDALENERSERLRAEGEAGDIVEAARSEVARMLATAEADVQDLYAAARRRIEMAAQHAQARLARSEATPSVEVSVRG